MQTLTLQITNDTALKTLHALEEKNLIKIMENSLDSPSLPREQLSVKAFKNWVTDAENTLSIDLKEAETKWASRKKQLQKLTR